MREIQLGKTNAYVSELCLGCLNFGTKTGARTSFQILDQYYEAGGRFLDTSNNYAFWNEGAIGGESERLIGDWMKLRNNRSEIFVATKVGAQPTIPGTGFETAEGLSRVSIINAVNKSLERLQTTYIDLYYAHIDDSETDLIETLKAFNELIKSGRVRHIGCSNYTYERLKEANDIANAFDVESYCCLQERYSYLQPSYGSDFGVQEVLSQELLTYCSENNISLMAYTPLLSGFYSGNSELKPAYITQENEQKLKNLELVSNMLGATPNQIVLAWMLQTSPMIIPLLGVSSVEQLSENMRCLEIKLEATHLDLLGQKQTSTLR